MVKIFHKNKKIILIHLKHTSMCAGVFKGRSIMGRGVPDKLKSKKSRSKADVWQVRNFGLNEIKKHCNNK